jgi:UDP-4-amino-4,6-dideoxy-N-acetyl-beta-L-altrosamine transaminase
MDGPFLPYGRQSVDEEDIAAVVAVLRGDWLTQGPEVEAFERDLAQAVGARHAIAFCNGTAALHAACFAAGLGPGDEVITAPLTFAASANCARYVGARPVFADVEPVAGTLDPEALSRALTTRTRAVIPVHYAGQPAQMAEIRAIARASGLTVIEDAAHALGAASHGRPVGACESSDMAVFSFHPVKHITTAEGGAVTTDDPELCERLRLFRSHGITKDPARIQRRGGSPGPWYCEQVELGHNMRLSDIHCALGRSQLRRLDNFVARRRALADRYDALLAGMSNVMPLGRLLDSVHAFHLYVVQIDFHGLGTDRARVMNALRDRGIGTQVHYIPVHLHPFHAADGWTPGAFPVAEAIYEQALSLPLFPAMADGDVDRVVAALREVLGEPGAMRSAGPSTALHPMAIVQARMGSSRLPGKVLEHAAGRTLLAHVIERLRRAATLSAVWVATTDRPEDDVIAAEATRLGVPVFRGSEDDVLDRYRGAAEASGAEVITRITADCPLLDPAEVDRVVGAFLQASPEVDYASNMAPDDRRIPLGMSVEVFSRGALLRAWREGEERHHREHVTPYLFEAPGRFRTRVIHPDEGCVDRRALRLTVDTPEDLAVVTAVLEAVEGMPDGMSLDTAAAWLEAHPEVRRINEAVRQRSFREVG